MQKSSYFRTFWRPGVQTSSYVTTFWNQDVVKLVFYDEEKLVFYDVLVSRAGFRPPGLDLGLQGWI